MKPVKQVPHNVSFLLPTGEKMPFRLVMDKETRKFDSVTQVYVAPYHNGRTDPTRGRWIDWDTQVTETES